MLVFIQRETYPDCVTRLCGKCVLVLADIGELEEDELAPSKHEVDKEVEASVNDEEEVGDFDKARDKLRAIAGSKCKLNPN